MLLFANNADSTLKTGVLATDVVLLLADGTGSRFPAAGGGDTFFITLIDDLGNVEIVECTERTGDALTVVRARDGTSARSFAAGSVVDHRVTAEVLRRLSPDSLRGEDNGLAPLDNDGLLPAVHLPTSVLTTTLADARYPLRSQANLPNGYAALDAGGKVPLGNLPSELLTLTEGDAAYVKADKLAAANGVATLDATGKIPAAQLPAAEVDLSSLAPKLDPVFPSDLTVGGEATVASLTVTGVATLTEVNATSLATTGTVTIKGGAPLGKRTLSTSPPSGTPAPGDEWIQYAA